MGEGLLEFRTEAPEEFSAVEPPILSQAEPAEFTQGLASRQAFVFGDGMAIALDLLSIPGRVALVLPAHAEVGIGRRRSAPGRKAMGTGAESEIGAPAPVGLIVARFLSGEAVVRNLVLDESRTSPPRPVR
jgi:hypothetical protein